MLCNLKRSRHLDLDLDRPTICRMLPETGENYDPTKQCRQMGKTKRVF